MNVGTELGSTATSNDGSCSSPHWDSSTRWIIVALVCVGIGFRIWHIEDTPALNSDEAWSGVQALKVVRGEEVSWKTPTGNIVNVLFLAPQVLLHALFPPSVLVLRCVSLASGVLALAVNYYACRRTLDGATAAGSTLLMAVLPVNIAYSRFAWDTSQTLLATTIVLYLAIAIAQGCRGWRLWCGMLGACGAALVVHPTNIFLLPVVVVLWGPRCYAWFQRRSPGVRVRWAIAAGAIVLILAAGACHYYGPPIQAALVRAASAREAVLFTVYLGRLLTGLATYRFMTGEPSQIMVGISDALAWLVLTLVVMGLVRRFRAKREALDACLGLGILAALLGFYLVAGAGGVTPAFERYALWTIAPLTLCAARGWAHGLTRGKPSYYGLAALATAVSVGLLTGFHSQYFHKFATTGGDAHVAFRTAPVEPKRAALELATSQAKPGEPVVIVSRNWWTQVSLDYLARSVPGQVNVVSPDEVGEWSTEWAGRAWFIELTGTDDERRAIERLERWQLSFDRHYTCDRSGRPIVTVLRADPPGPVPVTPALLSRSDHSAP